MRPPEKSRPAKPSNPDGGGLGNIDEQQGHPGAGSPPGPDAKAPGERPADTVRKEGPEADKGS